MKKYLITGYSGFVSPHFLNYLESLKEKCVVLGVDIHKPDFENRYRFVECSFQQMNLLEKSRVEKVLQDFQPDYILHLASYSSVAYSWKNPVASFVNNSNIFLNLVDQIRTLNLACRMLSVGSSEEYGNVEAEFLPLREDLPPKPISPYAIARVSQEMLSQLYTRSYAADIILTRSFNHIGPGQKEIFVIPAFAKKLVALEKDKSLPRKITVGNLEIVRDFVDVRDVVRAYHLLLQRGESGEIYNICSEKGYSLRSILHRMMEITGVDAEITVDETLIRPNDNLVITGSNRKINRQLGWKPSIDIQQSLQDIIDFWRAQLKKLPNNKEIS